MKEYYPYFNLFYKAGTTNYYLEMLVKMPKKCHTDEIVQSFDDEYWEVRLKLKEKKEEDDSYDKKKDKVEEYKIDLTPENVKQLEKIKIVVKNYDNHLKNGDSDGGGETSTENSEIEP